MSTERCHLNRRPECTSPKASRCLGYARVIAFQGQGAENPTPTWAARVTTDGPAQIARAAVRPELSQRAARAAAAAVAGVAGAA